MKHGRTSRNHLVVGAVGRLQQVGLEDFYASLTKIVHGKQKLRLVLTTGVADTGTNRVARFDEVLDNVRSDEARGASYDNRAL
jgi:hypothetical protein